MTTATKKNPPTIPADPEQVITLTAAQVAQHPANLRDPGRDIDRLAASIVEVGVLVPLIVVPVDQVPGQWPKKVTHVAVDGNRRQAAAAKAGAVLPCLVRPDVADAQATARTMAVTGLMRDGLTVIEEARAVQTMLDLGISQTAIGKATGRNRSYVRNAQAAATVDETLSVATDGYALTLDQLAELAGFTDDEDATSRLLDSAYEPGEWAHTLTYERQQREAAAAITVAREELTASGVTVLDEQGDYDCRVDSLLHDGQPITDHSRCPGQQVNIGFRHADGIHLTDYCADPTGNGHTYRYGSTGDGFGRDRTNETPEQAEQRKTERRELIRLNKIADAAQEVRRQFLRDQLASKSKTHHKTMTEWALLQVLSRDYFVTSWLADRSKVSAHPLDEILRSEQPVGVATSAPASRQPIMLWAYVVAAHEDTYHRDSHRQDDAGRAGYLRHLLDLGYTPAETDRLVMGERALAVDND